MMMRMRTTMMTRGRRVARRIDRQAGPDHSVIHLNLAVVHSHIYTGHLASLLASIKNTIGYTFLTRVNRFLHE